ncbi:MotA/TolQ/ExbB proton channel family protein [Taibaiella lutea]|uniref:MotA/TolQ/ExbB proton channel family protein n=1 Tax=Taibaiella lutea TaxID=2608001 RepID=A0A5M6CIH6_9BACT|nr:MotA/TolQ/ExbB proton channel family protein [Taibaiella lutea]KAA5533752.1 MotA/TolQ/ExbB proton channel family protein [Taibaiella lutea]
MSWNLFLQIPADTVAQMTQAVTPAAPEQLSLWFLLKEGGVLMIPLAICSLLAVYIFIERYLAIKKAGKAPNDFMLRIREKITEGSISGAQSLCKNYEGSVPRVISKGISRIGKPMDHIEKSMESSGKLEVYQMEKNLGILSTIAGIAPMFGFLGTIAGMIILFSNIQHTNTFEIGTIAGGIYTKMVTSAVGLIIGLLAYVADKYLNAQINKNVNKIEAASSEFLDILHQPAAV